MTDIVSFTCVECGFHVPEIRIPKTARILECPKCKELMGNENYEPAPVTFPLYLNYKDDE